MTVRSVSRLVRLVGFVVSPLITAPAAGADLERGALAPVAHSAASPMLRARHVAATATPHARVARRVTS
jgi:hypothetical protein